MFLGSDHNMTEKAVPKVVVRLKTYSWSSKRGVHQRRDLLFLKRQCEGYNVVDEDVSNVGASDVVSRIVNLDACPDGVYEVVICNEKRDWESGYVEDYDYKLVAVKS